LKITQEVKVNFASAYCGYGGLEITDVDGTEVKIKLNDEQWKDLAKWITRKVGEIERSEKKEFERAVDLAVADRMLVEGAKESI
jgi:hypothetical protein